MLNLDTHILVGALSGTLKPGERDLLAEESWGVSAIVLWELTMLSQRGRIEVDLHSTALDRALSGIQVWPIDLRVCRHLGLLDFSSDPADEVIAATSMAYAAPLVTRDRKLRASQVVPLAVKGH
ncbi:MAG: PIN domain-containing protein [Acidobacteria bacterium]|nr:PIN domain-containing protein [Acidobacteriota bacterium]